MASGLGLEQIDELERRYLFLLLKQQEIPVHCLINRGCSSVCEFRNLARLPRSPIVVCGENEALQQRFCAGNLA